MWANIIKVVTPLKRRKKIGEEKTWVMWWKMCKHQSEFMVRNWLIMYEIIWIMNDVNKWMITWTSVLMKICNFFSRSPSLPSLCVRGYSHVFPFIVGNLVILNSLCSVEREKNKRDKRRALTVFKDYFFVEIEVNPLIYPTTKVGECH